MGFVKKMALWIKAMTFMSNRGHDRKIYFEKEELVEENIMVQNTYSDDDRQYLQMMQANIERMANNSLNCKTWMVMIVTAFFALGCGIEALNGWIILALVPILVFWYLDTLYLQLERGMRNRQRDFLNKIGGNGYLKALYNFAPLMMKEDDNENGLVATDDRAFSKSIAPFYLSIVAIVVIVAIVLNWDSIIAIFFSIVQ